MRLLALSVAIGFSRADRKGRGNSVFRLGPSRVSEARRTVRDHYETQTSASPRPTQRDVSCLFTAVTPQAWSLPPEGLCSSGFAATPCPPLFSDSQTKQGTSWPSFPSAGSQ